MLALIVYHVNVNEKKKLNKKQKQRNKKNNRNKVLKNKN